MGVNKLAELMERSYIEFCHSEYFKGWKAQEKGQEMPDNVSDMFEAGWSDCYEYGEVMGSRTYE